MRGFAIALLALALASLLNADGLRKTAHAQPAGFRRDAALALTAPLDRVSHALLLDRPRRALKEAIGRAGDDRVDEAVVVALPPARPRPKPRPRPQPVRPAPRRPALPRVVPVRALPVGHAVPRRPPRPKPPPKPAFTPTRPLRVWVAGDSLVEVPGQSLERATGSAGAVRVVALESRLGTGLGRPDVYNWYTRFPEAIRDLHPQVAVLSFGSNDAHDYMSGVPSGRTIGPIGSASWGVEYRRRVDGVTRELAAAHVYVVWIGLPITRNPARNVRFRTINAILRSVSEEHPRSATYVDAYRMFLGPANRYADYLRDAHGRLVPIRAADGVHYQTAAGDLLAREILHRLNEVYDLTGWRRKPVSR